MPFQRCDLLTGAAVHVEGFASPARRRWIDGEGDHHPRVVYA
jgi:hypothetical protein